MIDPVDLTQRLIRCRSITPADDGALQIVADELQALGFEIHKLRFEGDGSYPVDNVFARIGTESPHICFLGHTDVVPPGHEPDWKYPPFAAEIHDGILYGRGAADMKSGVAAAMASASRFLEENKNFKGSISFLITGDEEADSINGSEKVIHWMEANGHVPDFALVAEPSNEFDMGETMRIGRRGSYHADLFVTGKQGHSAYPERFINPVEKMVKLLYAIVNTKLDSGSKHMPPSHIAITTADTGNKAKNVIAARASAHINSRFNDLWTSKTLDAKIRGVLDSVGESYELVSSCKAESFMTQSLDWADMVARAAEKISGTRPKYDTGGGTSDGRFIARLCPVVEYGVLRTTIHEVDEHTLVAHIESLTSTYVEVLKNLFQSNFLNGSAPSES